MHRRAALIAWVVFWVVASAHAEPPPAAPAVSTSEAARTFYERGIGHFQLDEYEKAIAAWEEGFRLKPSPEFLYNIAQAYRAWKKPEQALVFYKKFLRTGPAAQARTDVQRQIKSLEALIEQRKHEPPPVEPTPAPPIPVEPTPVVVTPPTPNVPPADATATLTSAPPAKKPITKRAWFWPVIGVSAVVVVGGVVALGVVLGRRSSEPTLPGVTF